MTRLEIREDSIYVVGVGAQTPVGRTALSAAAAVRCGLSAYAEHPFMIDRFGEPMVVAMAEWLDASMDAKARMIQMGFDAANEALAPLGGTFRFANLPIMFALSSSNLPQEADRKSVVEKIGYAFKEKNLTIRHHISNDLNAVGADAIRMGCLFLKNASEGICMILGTDSHLEPEQLEAIDDAKRLHSVNNSWGFTPGEGAGAVLLATGRAVLQGSLTPLAEIAAVGTGSEGKLLGTKTVCIGEGLSQAFRGALSSSEKVSHSYCDLNGETYRADEFGFAVCRTGGGFDDAGSFTAAAQSWGDVGAASIPLQIAIATSAWTRGFAKGNVSLCWSSSGSSALRGAVRLKNNWHKGAKI
jgi:3-oxoacyl-[acyl-carrier-protein] synthase I